MLVRYVEQGIVSHDRVESVLERELPRSEAALADNGTGIQRLAEHNTEESIGVGHGPPWRGHGGRRGMPARAGGDGDQREEEEDLAHHAGVICPRMRGPRAPVAAGRFPALPMIV